jgi:hypothetical protein
MPEGPVYKGSTFEIQPGKYDFQRGRGWQGTRIARGALADVAAEVQAMELYCNKIHFEVGTDYSEATGVFDGLTDGGDDTTSRGEEVWDIQYNEQEIGLLEGAYASDLEADHPGAIAVIQKAYDEFKKMDAEEVTGLYVPAGFIVFASVPVNLGRATTLFDRLVSGVTHVRFFQPVVVFSSTYGRPFTTQRPIPGRPTVYITTAALSSALPIPSDVLFQLPDGMWLEHPPQVRRTSGDRTEISQRWEWFELIDTIAAYPQ